MWRSRTSSKWDWRCSKNPDGAEDHEARLRAGRRLVPLAGLCPALCGFVHRRRQLESEDHVSGDRLGANADMKLTLRAVPDAVALAFRRDGDASTPGACRDDSLGTGCEVGGRDPDISDQPDHEGSTGSGRRRCVGRFAEQGSRLRTFERGPVERRVCVEPAFETAFGSAFTARVNSCRYSH